MMMVGKAEVDDAHAVLELLQHGMCRPMTASTSGVWGKPRRPSCVVIDSLLAPRHGQNAPRAAPQLGSSASSGRSWRLWAARHSQGEAQPLGAQPLPRLLVRAASKAADPTAF